MQRLVVAVAVAIGLNVTAADAAKADPITSETLRITSGNLEFDWTDIFTGFSAAGANFSTGFAAGPSPRELLEVVDGRVDPSFAGPLRVENFTLRVGARVIESPDQPWTFRFEVDAPSVVPHLFEDGSLGVSFPFALSASFFGSADNETFRYDFVGRGRGNLFATGFNQTFLPQFGNLTFEDAPPIPEPSTLLLMGAGVGIAVARRRRRQ
jgi:hypothetical protein